MHDAEASSPPAAWRSAAGKPVVVVKLGASDEGRAAALAHTGALAGAMEAFDAVAGAAGAIRVRKLDDVVEAVEFLVHAPLPTRQRARRASPSRAACAACCSMPRRAGLAFSAAGAEDDAELSKSFLSVGTVIGNPLDSGFAALTSADAYLRCVEIMLADPGIDMLLLQEELPRAPGTERKEANLRAVNEIAAKAGKPIAFVTMISHGLTDYSRDVARRIAQHRFPAGGRQDHARRARGGRLCAAWLQASAAQRDEAAAGGGARNVPPFSINCCGRATARRVCSTRSIPRRC